MDVLQALGLLLLLTGPCLSTGPPSQDYWGQYGPYGQCSRTCGTGVAVRTRTCITSRTDGGHNCVGPSKSYRTCNLEGCPVPSRDFREEQCSHFDRVDFQGKRYTWLPYHGASNPCELNCVPRGDSFFYRHRPRVVDGTPCYVGRSDICVEGVCRAMSHGEILGLDHDTPYAPAPRLRETLSYAYTYGVYSECSAPCNGGMQTRSMHCVAQDVAAAPRVVDESHCIALALQRPASQKACNMHACAEYTASSFSVCSVPCGEGQQTREVFCVGAGGERLNDTACRGLTRPPSVQVCQKPACHVTVGWHVTNFGLCSRNCGGGVRERSVRCMDTNLNPYPEDRCRAHVRPPSMDTCNKQACPGAQEVPSVQDPRGHDNAMRGFVRFVPGEPTAHRPQTNVVYDPYSRGVVGAHCVQSYYGCCPDGHTPATGPRGEGCHLNDCLRSRYGCCLDGVTMAQGFGRAGCPDYYTPVESPSVPPSPSVHPSGAVCSLARDEGPCDTWKSRFFFNAVTGRCTHFWFGGCHGNANNFASMAECQRQCGGVPAPATPARRAPVTARGGPRRRA